MKRLIVLAFAVVSTLGVVRPAAAADFSVTNSGMSAWNINGQLNPPLTLTRGHSYTFEVNALGHPFWIKTAPGSGTDNPFDTGVTNNGLSTGTLTFTVPASAPAQLYYQCAFHDIMTGPLTIISATVPTPVPAATDATRGVLGAALALLGFTALGGVRRARMRRKLPG